MTMTREFIEQTAELLESLEWQYTRVPCSHGCCYDWVYQCPSCEETQDTGHLEGCSLAARLREAREYLKEATEREGLTIWDRIQDETLSCHPS